jgi:putative tryptophan/tyrosine transport system substrate-binding protein
VLPRGLIGRRTFLASIVGVVVAPLAIQAQQTARVFRIAFLSNGNRATSEPAVQAFVRGLREYGWIDRQNVAIEYRWADGNLDRLPALAVDLLKTPVDVVVVAGGPAVRAVRQATRTIPIVSAITTDPVAQGFAASLARPGGNITGSAVQFDSLATKQLQIIKEVLPKADLVAILTHRTVTTDLVLKAAESAARTLALKARVFEIRDASDLEAVFRAAKAEQIDAMYVTPSPTFARHKGRLAELAIKHRLPGIYEDKQYVEAGGLMSYGPSFIELYYRAASYVDRILKGAKPGDLPIEQPTKFELAVNLKTAKALGLTIQPALLQRADQVIE